MWATWLLRLLLRQCTLYFEEAERSATEVVVDAVGESRTSLQLDWKCPNFCRRWGVSCSDAGVAVTLSNQNLTGWLPDVPTVSSTMDVVLTELNLSKNRQIRGTPPSSWLTLPNLVVLNVDGCGIPGRLPDM